MHYVRIFLLTLAAMLSPLSHATPDAATDEVTLSVWTNEAIVAAYTYTHQNFLARQKEIAHYFTPEGWQAYSKAFMAAKIPETVQKNSYFVSAVATMPPAVRLVATHHWQATMPLLVVYKSPTDTQKQTLGVTLDFIEAPAGVGVRGLAIVHLTTKVIKPLCACTAEKP